MTVSTNVLITGASGLLGRAVLKYFTNKGDLQQKYPILNGVAAHKLNCLGLCHSRVKENLRAVDLTDLAKVDALVEEFKPHVIVHCAAERKVDVVEKNFEQTMKLNADVTEFLAQLSAQKGIFFIYISTDYVFDGKKPPYKIDSEPNPLNKYGSSKLRGETVTQKASLDHCVVRVPVLYGLTEEGRFNESAINILYEKVRQKEPFAIDHVQIRYPTHTLDVARFLLNLVIKRLEDKSDKIKGIFHCSGLEAFTKYEMSCIMADVFNMSKSHINPDMSAKDQPQQQLRPENSQLDTSYSYDVLEFKPYFTFRDSIKECLTNFDS